MGYEEVSKAYRVYDIEADQVMISRDVTFDESTFVFLQTLPQEIVDDTALEFDSINISDEHCTTQFKQTGKRNTVQAIKNKTVYKQFLLVMEPGQKKQVQRMTLSHTTQNDD